MKILSLPLREVWRVFFLLPTLAWGQSGDAPQGDHPDGAFIHSLYLETRLACEYQGTDGHTIHENSGFRGRYLNLRLDGQIVDGLTYSYRQRLNKPTDARFFDATDWLHLDWAPNRRWSVSAGKQVVAIGGWEYDRAPILLYGTSEFWNHIPCYQLGASVTHTFSPRDQLTLQVCNSPFHRTAGGNTYAINLLWRAQRGVWSAIWSYNAMQTARGHWIDYIALGNRFEMGRRVALEVDHTQRIDWGKGSALKDCTLSAELSVAPASPLRCHAKYTMDVNRTGSAADVTVQDGTLLHSVSGGLEADMVKKYPQTLLLYGVAGYSWGENTNPAGVLQDKGLSLQVGLRFKMDILEATRRLIDHRNKKHSITS